MNHYFYRTFVVFILFAVSSEMQAQVVVDTIKSHPLQEVSVHGRRPVTTKTTSPLQVLEGRQLQLSNALQVSDAVKYFSGVQVRDYGGVGGLKTISVRSLGANYTTVAYDGIAVSNYQSGQVDLGHFSLENVELLTLNIGESDDIFQSAKVQASAGALNIITRKPERDAGRSGRLKLGLKGGSFGLLNPSLVFDQVLSKTFSAQIATEWLQTDGNYPFTQYYGTDKDSSSTENRNNSDVETAKIETNLWGSFDNGGKLSLKVHGYHSDRGLPGPAIYYNNQASADRGKEQNYFAQTTYSQVLNEKWNFQANAKFNFQHTNYWQVGNNYPGGQIENAYFEREYYLNTTFLYQPSQRISFSWANDGALGNFNSNVNNYSPSRLTWQSVVAGKYENGSLTLTGSLLATAVDESLAGETAPDDLFSLSPYLGLSVRPFQSTAFRFRAFYKNTYRMPTFGDLYSFKYPTLNLSPENANQFNLGVTWVGQISAVFSYLSLTADVYRNKIENKIVAYPKSSLFIWSVQNLGKVDIQGVDVNLNLHIQPAEKVQWRIGAVYTWQKVLDKTNPESETYDQQIIYTPHHSGSGHVSLLLPWLELNYTWLFCGKRYFGAVNRIENSMDAYVDQGISLSKTYDWKKLKISLFAECQNLFDNQYEVVRSYPMPGRSFRWGMKFIY